MWTAFRNRLSAQSSRSLAARSRRAAYRPVLLTLEERLAPATVTTLADSGVGSLRNLLLNPASQGCVDGFVDFAPALAAQTIRLTSGQIQLGCVNPVAIDGSGRGMSISGQNRDRIFEIMPGRTVTINGLLLVEGFARTTAAGFGVGGAIRNQGNLTLNSMFFVYNRAGGSGGAIDTSRQSNARTTINDSYFAQNRAITGFGGALSANDQTVGAGDLAILINNSYFLYNAANGSGGAIDYFIPLNSTGTFELTVAGSYFAGNEGSNGGAINVNDRPTAGTLAINLINNIFDSNHAVGAFTQAGGDSGFGGAVDLLLRPSGSATVTANVTGGFFLGNWANLGGGLAASVYTLGGSSTGTINIDEVFFYANQGVRGGGAYLEVQGASSGTATINVRRSLLSDNVATSFQVGNPARIIDGNGGGLYGRVFGDETGVAQLNLINSTFAYNAAVTSTMMPSQADGGGLYLLRTSEVGPHQVALDSLTVAYNEALVPDATNDGGGLYVNNANGFQPTVRNSVFCANRAGDMGPDVFGTVTSAGWNSRTNAGGHAGFGSPTDNVLQSCGLDTELRANGGPTLSLLPLAGSPLIATGNTTQTQDQRLYLRSNPTSRGAVDPNAVAPDSRPQGQAISADVVSILANARRESSATSSAADLLLAALTGIELPLA